MAHYERLRSILKQHHCSVTQARLQVFAALVGQEPVTMHSLVQRLPTVDRASVYRTIELFERLGIVQRLNTGWKYRLELSDLFSEHHHHLTCTGCGVTLPMNEAALEAAITKLARLHGFKPTLHQIEIQGLCRSCLRNG